MKVGGKLLCKTASVTYYMYIEKTKYYTITDITDNDVSVSVMVTNNTQYFSLEPNNIWYIWNYFYTTLEMRKMKLKQLKYKNSRILKKNKYYVITEIKKIKQMLKIGDKLLWLYSF